MAEKCSRVIYCNPEVRAFPSIKQGCLGRGFEGVEHVKEFWPHLQDIDLFVFPDSNLSRLQRHLETQGCKVWGSREGQDFEQRRKFFMETLDQLGMDVAPYVEIVGLDALREHLRDKEDKWIKVSHWRGDMETTHWRNWRLDEGWLDWMAVNLGPLKKLFTFLVFDAIETDLEIGGDTYNVLGKWPSLMLNGFEGKDKTYMATVMKRGDMPDQIQDILEAFAPLLANCDYRNHISFEVRVKGDKAYWNDATQRAGMPSSASQQLLYENYPEIVWAGANGELLDPEPAYLFSIETIITSKGGGHDCWDAVEVPRAIERFCRFSNCCIVDGLYCFPPDELKGSDLGWLTAQANTPRAAFEKIKGYADQLPDGLNADVESLVEIVKEIESAAAEGIPFTEKPLPTPEEIVT